MFYRYSTTLQVLTVISSAIWYAIAYFATSYCGSIGENTPSQRNHKIYRLYTHTHTLMHTHMYAHMQNAHTRTHSHACTHAHTHALTWAHTYTHIHTHTHTHTHAHTHTHTRTHTHNAPTYCPVIVTLYWLIQCINSAAH